MVQVNLSAKQKYRHRHKKGTCGHQGGRRGGMNWETGVDIYTVLILHIKSMSKDLVYSTGKSTQCSVVK